MNKANIHKILSFDWRKTIILIILGLVLFFYGLNNSYTCIDELSGVLIDTECAKLNFLPHLLIKIGTAILLSPTITILYSLFRYFKKKKYLKK